MTKAGVICVLLLLPVIGGFAWAISSIVPWWGCVLFGVVGILYSIGLLVPIERIAKRVILPDEPGDMERRIELAVLSACREVSSLAEHNRAALMDGTVVTVYVEVTADALRCPDGVDLEHFRSQVRSVPRPVDSIKWGMR